MGKISVLNKTNEMTKKSGITKKSGMTKKSGIAKKVAIVDCVNKQQKEITGGNTNYYLIDISNPKRLEPYVVEVEDIIEALDMSFAEGTVLKSLIRLCQLRKNLGKPGSSPLYESQKIKYYADRLLVKYQKL